MHVLTKIFAVLVSMLAVFLVPLVVVYAHNENSFKSKYEGLEAQISTLRAESAAASARNTAAVNDLETENSELKNTIADLQRGRVEAEAEVRRLESDLATERSSRGEIDAQLATLATALKVSQDLTESLVGEVRGLRTDSLALERQKVELDEALRDITGQLDVAVQARRALQEEVTRIRDELASSISEISRYREAGARPIDDNVALGVTPNRNLDATIIEVRRSADQTLAEIDAGSLDGVQVGWVIPIARGGTFKGKLRIINVDVSRSTGIVTLEDPLGGREVETGDTAYARIGED